MTVQILLWALIPACIGGLVAVIWMLSMRDAADKQRRADAQELRQAKQREQMANMNAQGWKDAAHRHEVQLAYLHGVAAGRSYGQQLPPAAQESQKPVDAEGFVRRGAVGMREA